MSGIQESLIWYPYPTIYVHNYPYKFIHLNRIWIHPTKYLFFFLRFTVSDILNIFAYP